MALAESTLKRMHFFLISILSHATCSFFNFFLFHSRLNSFSIILHLLYFAEGSIGLLVSHLKQQIHELVKQRVKFSPTRTS